MEFLFQNCKALTGSRYNVYSSYLLIQNLTSDDAGDYTCKLLHNENGANYTVTATRSLYVKGMSLTKYGYLEKDKVGRSMPLWLNFLYYNFFPDISSYCLYCIIWRELLYTLASFKKLVGEMTWPTWGYLHSFIHNLVFWRYSGLNY